MRAEAKRNGTNNRVTVFELWSLALARGTAGRPSTDGRRALTLALPPVRFKSLEYIFKARREIRME